MTNKSDIYHITHINNLISIIDTNGLKSFYSLEQQKINYQNIAHRTIQSQRNFHDVPCGPKKNLHDYIPFYFAPRSPMLYSIHRGNVEGYDDGQEQVIHLCSKIETVYQAKRLFVFTDGHAIMNNSNFYDDLVDLDQIDWDIMEERYWADTLEDSDRKRRRQAEFLVYEFCPWELITHIGVMTTKIQEKVAQIVKKSSHQPNIKVHRNWYY
jgi:hypothetical protein